jgi:hypothetical protein
MGEIIMPEGLKRKKKKKLKPKTRKKLPKKT